MNIKIEQIDLPKTIPCVLYSDAEGLDIYINSDLTAEDREFILRIPVIPNVNDDMGNISATADFILNELGGKVRTLQLLSFMRLGEEKYTSLGMPYEMKDVKMNRRSFQKHVNELADYFNSRGIHCLVGTKEKE